MKLKELLCRVGFHVYRPQMWLGEYPREVFMCKNCEKAIKFYLPASPTGA